LTATAFYDIIISYKDIFLSYNDFPNVTKGGYVDTQKEEFRDIVRFLNNMDERRRIRFIRQMFKAVGDRAGPTFRNGSMTMENHFAGVRSSLLGLILKDILSNAYENIREEK
jgi:hypothetical protein